MSNELRPCPFCGKPAVIEKDLENSGFPFQPRCHSRRCSGSNGTWFTSREEAVEAWNTRCPLPPLSDGLLTEREQKFGFPCVFCKAKNFEDAGNKCKGEADCPGANMSREVFADIPVNGESRRLQSRPASPSMPEWVGEKEMAFLHEVEAIPFSDEYRSIARDWVCKTLRAFLESNPETGVEG